MEKEILKALKKVFDPEISINIVDMGLIYNIKEKEGKVSILMTLTSPACPYSALIKNSILTKVKKVKGVKQVTVKFTFTPLWTPDKITKEAKFRLY